jgi:hypothetical protein
MARIGIPYAPKVFDDDGLASVCPVCREHVREHADQFGESTNRYAEHYEREHSGVEPSPDEMRKFWDDLEEQGLLD